jgi:hypothetical protein
MLDLAITWLPIIGTIVIGLGISIWYGKGNKSYAILIGLAGAILVAAGFSVHLKKIVWESQVSDRPIVLPVDIGQIRLSLPNGQTSVPHVKFRIRNYGKGAAVLRRVQGKFMMLELPLTKEKATGNNRLGQTQISSWTNSTVLGPGDTIETDAFAIPESIRIDEYQGYGQPNFATAAQLFLFVTIDYEDLSWNGGWIGFTCWKYERQSNGIFTRYGEKEWNYEQEAR